MKRTISIIIAALVVMFAAFIADAPLSPTATAQNAAKKQLYNLTIVHVRPELWLEYTDFIKNTVNPLQIKGGLKAKYVWRPDRGDRFELYNFVPVESYAAMGVTMGPDPIQTALGSTEATALFYQQQRKFQAGTEILTIEALPDISWTNPKLQGQPQLALMRWTRIAPGRSTEVEDFLKNYDVPARRKTVEQSNMLGQWRYRVRFGGDVNRYLMIRPMASYAELDDGGTKGLGQILGAAEYKKITDQLPKGTILQDEAYLMHFRPDLSILPQPTTAEKK